MRWIDELARNQFERILCVVCKPACSLGGSLCGLSIHFDALFFLVAPPADRPHDAPRLVC